MSVQIPDAVRPLLRLADAKMFHGLQLGLWVDRGPTMEECIALSSIGQDELGHARALYDAVAAAGGPSVFQAQYDRATDDFDPPALVLVPRGTWADLVMAFAVTDRLMLHVLQATPEAAGFAKKLAQEERWHMHHGDAWLQSLGASDDARAELQGALDRLWPAAAQWLHELPAAVRTAALDDMVPALEDAGLSVRAAKKGDGWTVEPAAGDDLDADVQAAMGDVRVELVAMLQDPQSRAIAEAFETG